MLIVHNALRMGWSKSKRSRIPVGFEFKVVVHRHKRYVDRRHSWGLRVGISRKVEIQRSYGLIKRKGLLSSDGAHEIYIL